MSSIKKFLLSSLVCACAFLFLFGSTACVTINYINSQSSTSQESSSSNSSSQSSSNSSSTSQDSSSSDSSSQDSTDDNSGNTGNKPEPTPLDANDLADTKYSYTKIINDWVVHSTLTQQSSFASEDSNYALKGSFNYKDGTPYTANGANSIWTTPCFDLEEYYGSAQNLQGKAVSFDVKIENTSSEAAVSIMRTDGIRQTEHILNLKPYAAFSNVSIVKETLNDEWVRFTVNLGSLFSANLLTNVKYIVLVFSNVGCNEEIDSVYYVDNMSIETATPLEWYTDSYNPDKYYSKNETLNIHLAGNSFIYYSNTAGWLNTIATLNNANLTASFTWVPNGRIPNQYEEAFSLYGYMNENYQPNLLYIQDFYDFNDAFALNFFAEKLMEISPYTELKIYTAENETTDGLLAGENMGLDVVNWRALIKDLKTRGFTIDHLNDARDGWHPNELSGVIGAILIYMDLYGEIPNIDTLFDKMQITSDNFYGTTLTNYLPGTTSQEKYNSLSLIFTLAAEYANL